MQDHPIKKNMILADVFSIFQMQPMSVITELIAFLNYTLCHIMVLQQVFGSKVEFSF